MAAIVKSSPVPISTAEANESISMLIKLCPFFVKKLNISGEEYIEMPSSNTAAAVSTSAGSTEGKPNLTGSSRLISKCWFYAHKNITV